MAAFFVSSAHAAAANNLVIGINGHAGWTHGTYVDVGPERIIRTLADANIRSYRVDVANNARSIAALDALLPHAKAKGVMIRPMLYVHLSDPENDAYTMAKRYGRDLRLWELGNELNLKGEANFADNIERMKKARRGIERAAAELGVPLKTTLNVAAVAGMPGLDMENKTYPFVDQAIQAGLKFDYISFHVYTKLADATNGWNARYLDPLHKYGKPVLLNEFNCQNIYIGDDGNSEVCAATVDSVIQQVKSTYSDLIVEVNAYELYDNHAAEGVEEHFGFWFDKDTPKKNWAVLTKAAESVRIINPDPADNFKGIPEKLELTRKEVLVKQVHEALLKTSMTNAAASNSATDIQSTADLLALQKKLLAQTEVQARFKKLSNRAFVADLYESVYLKPADKAFVATMAMQLDRRALQRESLLRSIFNMPEYRIQQRLWAEKIK